MARTQGAALDRKKLMGDPILVTTIVVLITFLTLFILSMCSSAFSRCPPLPMPSQTR